MTQNTDTARTLPADKFARIVTALAKQLAGTPGAEWLFMVTETADVDVWRPRVGTLVLQLDGRTVTVTQGVERSFDVVAGDALLIGETRGAEAAFSIALDYVTAPQRAASQHEHDTVSV
jgi:hypothetical protein